MQIQASIVRDDVSPAIENDRRTTGDRCFDAGALASVLDCLRCIASWAEESNGLLDCTAFVFDWLSDHGKAIAKINRLRLGDSVESNSLWDCEITGYQSYQTRPVAGLQFLEGCRRPHCY